jgi:MFS family permease
VAVFSMASDTGAIIGPLVAGLLADQVGYPAAFGLGAALSLLAALNAFRMPRVPPGSAPAFRPGTEVRKEIVDEPEASL